MKLCKIKHYVVGFLCLLFLFSPKSIMGSNSIHFTENHVRISVSKKTIKQIFDIIEKNSEYVFVYTPNPQLNKKTSVDVQDATVEETLQTILSDTNLEYEIKGKQILVSEAKVDSQNLGSKSAQNDDRNLTIQGQILENSEPPYPIIGVSVTIKGLTGVGTISDENGYFAIKAKRGDVIIFSYLGFQSYEYIVSRAINNLTVPMKEDVEMLDEVVVTGMSEEKKLNTISSISSLDVESNMQTKPITSLSQALQGGITGLAVSQSSGMPGADDATIKIRGISSLETQNDPLVLVDGIPMPMNTLDPNTIESVTVLKDAAASAIYGARAANGVIVVKTKRGMPGRVKVSYNGYYGWQKGTYLPKFVDAAGYMEMVNSANLNIGGSPLYDQNAIDQTRNGSDPVKYPNTNWTNYLFGTGTVQSHAVSISGGSNLARFALSVNYLDNEGIARNTNHDRLSIRANTSVSLLENLSVNMDFNSSKTNREKPLFDNGGDIFHYIYSTPPNTVIHYPLKEGSDIVHYGNRPEQRNPAALIERGGIRENANDMININISPRWEVIENLILRGQYSYRIGSGVEKRTRAAYNFFDYTSGAFLQTWGSSNGVDKDRSSYYYIGGTAEYTLELGKHRMFGIVGYNQEQTNEKDWEIYAMRSFFGKLNYTYDRRYLIEGTIRHDGSSRFGPGNKYGVFPSVGMGWNVHEESFLLPYKEQVNEFKVRGSWGLLGNENIGLYKYQTLIDPKNGKETVYGNPDITWETVQMFNIGVDLRLFKNLGVTFDYYDKLTKDMIITPPISYIGGTKAAPLNAGEVRNKGWELSLNYGRTIADFGFNIHAGLSQNKNKIEKLFNAPYDNGTTIHQIGYALDSYLVYPTDGLLQESDFTKDGSGKWIPKEGIVIFDGQQPGDIKYLDVSGPDGKKDGKITPDDRQIRGDSQPDLNYFSKLALTYKKWDFEILLQGVTGVEAYYSEPYSFGLNVSGDGQTPLAVQSNYWTPTNTSARYPRMAPNSSYGNNAWMSDFWKFDASYARIKYIQLGYTFDQMELRKAGISSLRVYVNTQNPFTFAKEKLTDPESRGQRGSYPLIKTYSFGLSLNF